MTAHVGVSGVWKDISDIHVGVSGAWKQVTEGYVGVSGVWKEFYSAIALTNQQVDDIDMFGSYAQSGYMLDNDGYAKFWTTATPATGNLERWYSGATPSNYESRVTVTAGALSGGAVGTWENLGTDRSWYVTQTGVGGASVTMTVEIRNAGTGTVVATAEIILTATVLGYP